ncbi:MAG: tetratricopeptide repeat protein [Deltaproteobacteria bacterium]|nr:tetratricopeptide repeat protein [Deltaproteobacteria bacterium]
MRIPRVSPSRRRHAKASDPPAGDLLSPLLAPPAHAIGTDSPASAGRPADKDFETGKRAIEGQNWKAALDAFNRVAAREPRNADVQNYLGFAWRKSGNVDLAFKHYQEALRLDPKHLGAHEYIGEAYLTVDNLPKAEEHLAQLGKLCSSCEGYRELKKAVAEYRQSKRK